MLQINLSFFTHSFFKGLPKVCLSRSSDKNRPDRVFFIHAHRLITYTLLSLPFMYYIHYHKSIHWIYFLLFQIQTKVFSLIFPSIKIFFYLKSIFAYYNLFRKICVLYHQNFIINHTIYIFDSVWYFFRNKKYENRLSTNEDAEFDSKNERVLTSESFCYQE